MSQQPTCGQGVAANAALPAALGDVIAALARNLDTHQRALDLSDPAARQEHDAYTRLLSEQCALAEGLSATAQHMGGYRDLPMGKHDMQVMTAPPVLEAFQGFVHAEEQLLKLLQGRLEQDRAMLEVIAGHVRRQG